MIPSVQVASQVRRAPCRLADGAVGSAPGVHPQTAGRRLGPGRRVGAEGTRVELGQAAVPIDVEAGQARPIQGALTGPVLAGVGTVPVVKALVARLVAPPVPGRVCGP